MVVLRGVSLERKHLVDLSGVFDGLKLLSVALDLLLEVFDSLGYTARNFEIVLHLFHGGSGFGLTQSIFG